MITTNPGCIYHYCAGPAFENIVRSGKLWLGDSHSTNDSQENEYASAIIAKALNDYLPTQLASSINYFYQDLREAPHIGCFSALPDSLAQWRAYADNGTGYAIGLNSSAMVPKCGPPKIEVTPGQEKQGTILRLHPGLMEVVYSRAVQRRMVKDICDQLRATAGSHGELGVDWARAPVLLISQLLSISYCIKHPGFREEKEWRLVAGMRLEILSELVCEVDYLGHDDVDGVQRSYIVWPLNGRVPIAEVRIGPRNTMPVDIVQEFVSRHGFDDTRIVRSRVPYQ